MMDVSVEPYGSTGRVSFTMNADRVGVVHTLYYKARGMYALCFSYS